MIAYSIGDESKLETMISYLIVIGVTLSIILEILGLILYFGTYGNLEVSTAPNIYITGENFFSFIIDKLANLFISENALLFMTFGLIVLILTPYTRAITSLIYFCWKKNSKYVLITLFVLVVLTISLLLH